MLWRWLYTLVFYVALPLIMLRLYRRGRKNSGYRQRFAERFGRYPVAMPRLSKSIWLHTVSVGEFMAALPLIAELQQRYPDADIIITTMTPTGADQVRKSLGDRVTQVFLPYDLPHALARFHQHFQPQLLVIIETELWPNLINSCYQRQVPVLLINARLSAKSAQGYQRLLPLTNSMLQQLSHVAAQSEASAQRFLDLGLPEQRCTVTGTLKFDVQVDQGVFQKAAKLRQRWGQKRPVFCAASTHQGEEEQVLEAFKRMHGELPELLLLLVPRHPERFDAVVEIARSQGWQTERHSEGSILVQQVNVLVGDTMGELLVLLCASDLAFIGGSLEPVGGHNMLEALAVGTPAISGPHVFNFSTVAELLTAAEVLKTVTTPQGLADTALRLFKARDQLDRLAADGMAVINQQRGAVQRDMAIISRYLPLTQCKD